MARKSGRRNQSAVTIQDVARRAGVSMMSVSRALKGQSKVGEKTRAKILAVAKELKYKPNVAARRLAAADDARIGLLFTNATGAYMTEFLVGVMDEAAREGAELLLEKCKSTELAALRAAVRRLTRSQVGGVLLPPPLCESEPLLLALQRADIAAVSVATGRAMSGASCVRIDEFQAAYEMTEFLLGLGHRQLGFVKGHPNLSASAERLRGFTAALSDAGSRAERPIVVAGEYSYRSGLDAGRKLLDRESPPTAIFASNDDMAAAVLSVAHSKGLDVPRDLSVVGFDDTPIASAVWPELTTIRQPVAQMAKIALKILTAEMKQDGDAEESIKGRDRLVDHTLVVRNSSGPPHKRR